MWRLRLWEVSDDPEIAHAIWITCAALVCWLLVFIHATNIGHAELSLDEAGTWGVARRSLGTLVTLPTEFHSQPPLYYVLLHVLIQINDQPWVLRAFSLFWFLLAIQFVLFFFDELSLHARLLLCLILIYGDLTSYLATAVRPYGMATFLALGSCVLLVRVLRQLTTRRLWAYGVWTVLFLYTTAFAAATFMVQGLVALGFCLVEGLSGREPGGWQATWRRRWPLLVALVGISLAYLPYLLMAVHYQYQPNTSDNLPLVLSADTYLTSLAAQFRFPKGLMFVLYLLAAFGVVGELKQRRGEVLLWPLLVVGQIAFVWFFIVGRTGGVGVQGKYLMPAYLAAAVLATNGFQVLAPFPRKAIWLVIPVALVVVVLPQWSNFHTRFQAPPPLGPFGLLHQHMAAQPGKKLIFFDTGYEGQHLEYVTRNDPDVAFGMMRGTGWASGGDNHLTDKYIVDTINRTQASTRCYFYYLENPKGVYATAFVPAMQRLGYTQLPSTPVNRGRQVPGFCRPLTGSK